MERLTERLHGDGLCYGKVDCEDNCTYCDRFLKVLDKLADYEDKEEQGLLLELPVPLGEEVYCILGREISKNRVISYQTPPSNVDGVIAKGYTGTLLGIVGKNVFATEAEAEEALARMKGE